MAIVPKEVVILIAILLSINTFCESSEININETAFMSEVIHRLDVIGGENLKIKTNIGNIEKEMELQADKIVVVSDLLVKVQKQTNKFLPKTSFVISGQTKNEKKYLKVSCSGACNGINILLDPSEGDPDLCASEDTFPSKIDDHECKLCSSQTPWEDSCNNLKTNRDSFFVLVSAFEKYSNATLDFNGGNLKSVIEVDNFITDDFEEKILDNVKATIASITDTHDKDIEEVTETLCDVATRLNSIQNGNKNPVDKYTLPDRNILEETKKAISTMTHNEVCGTQPWRNLIEQHPRKKSFCGHGGRFKRVVKGNETDYLEWPWQVQLLKTSRYSSNYSHICGGTLLNKNWVITAAHCVDKGINPEFSINNLLTRFGEHDLESTDEPHAHIDRKVEKIITHPKWKYPPSLDSDIALLKLANPVDYDVNIIPICLPPDDNKLVGEIAWVKGWGNLYQGGPSPTVLHEASLPIVANDKCKDMLFDTGISQSEIKDALGDDTVPNTMICAGGNEGKSACNGDSGGPLVVQREDQGYILSGIVSWGIRCENFAVFTRVSEFRDWISQYVQF